MIKWTNGKKDVTECKGITIKVGMTRYECVRDLDNDLWIIMDQSFVDNELKTTYQMVEFLKFIDNRPATFEVSVTELDEPIGKRNPNVDKFISSVRSLQEVTNVEDNSIEIYKMISEYMLKSISDAISIAYLTRDLY